MTGPSHHQGFAGMTLAAPTHLKEVASFAIFDAGTQRLATNVSGASDHHALGDLLYTSVTQREMC